MDPHYEIGSNVATNYKDGDSDNRVAATLTGYLRDCSKR
jgi:hypothetical protein